jgi:SRP40, C-terminal domain
VSYDYADSAHRDLVVTKGKGFTKEKQKKKRGAYKGGYIDTVGVKGIKFDD